MPGQGCSPCPSSPADHQFAPDDLLLTTLIYPDPSPAVTDSGSSRPRRSEAWDLTSDARLAFHFLTLVPNQLPGWAGTHDDVPIRVVVRLSIAHIHTPSCTPLVGARSFRTSSPAYPHDPLVADRLLSTKRRSHQTGGCPRLPSSDLYHLPISPLQRTRTFC